MLFSSYGAVIMMASANPDGDDEADDRQDIQNLE